MNSHAAPSTRSTSGLIQKISQRQHVIYVLVLVVVCGLLFHKAQRSGGLLNPDKQNDFLAYHQAAVSVLESDLPRAYNLELPKPYQYPPSLATLIVPLGLLPYQVGLLIWIALQLFLFLWVFRSLDEILGMPVKGIDKTLGLLLMFRLFQSDFANGNANTLVLAFLMGGFLFFKREKMLLSGAFFSLAAAIKVFPILIAPWLLYKKRFKLAGFFLLGLIVWGVLIPGTILGPKSMATCYGKWSDTMLSPSAGIQGGEEAQPEMARGTYVAGQSLRSFWFHLLRDTDATAHDDDVFTVNVAHLSVSSVEWVYRITGAVLLLSLLVIFWRKGHPTLWTGPEIAIACLLMPVLSPLARKAHFVVLFPAAVLAFAIARTSKGARRKPLFILWGFAFCLIVFSSPGALGPWLSKRVMAFSPLTWASISLALIIMVPPLWGWRGKSNKAPCSKIDPKVFNPPCQDGEAKSDCPTS